jgi:hypothetical protein
VALRISAILVEVRVMRYSAFRAVKTLDLAVLPRFVGLNKLQLNLVLFNPELHVVARILRTITDGFEFTMEVNEDI